MSRANRKEKKKSTLQFFVNKFLGYFDFDGSMSNILTEGQEEYVQKSSFKKIHGQIFDIKHKN